jgi:VWFA-related protein
MRLFVAGLLCAGLLLSQQQQPETELPDQIFRTGINVVVAPTVVTDHQGNYVSGLQPNDFRVLDNGKSQTITVDVSFVPISLVVAIQSNSSAEPVLGKIQKIGPLLRNLVVGEQGEVAILAFDHRIQMLQDFTSDTDKIEQAVKKLKPGSSTSAMIDSVVFASRMLRKRPKDHRRVLLLISETRDKGSSAKIREALTDLQFDDVSVYTVNINRVVTTLLAKPQPPRPDPYPPGGRPLPPGVPLTPSSAEQLYGSPANSANFIPLFVEIFKQAKSIFVDNPVEVFTKWTGGKERSFLTERDLEAAVSEIGAELHSEYLITYAPNNKEEAGYHELEISVPRYPGIQIRTRPGYWVAARFQ